MDDERPDVETTLPRHAHEMERIRVNTEKLREDMDALLGILRKRRAPSPEAPAERPEPQAAVPERRA